MDGALAHRIGKCPRRSRSRPTACNCRRISISTPPPSVVPYLKALGITHLYASPFMRARKGSAHGYDVTDHAQFNPELGGEAGFERLSAVLRQHDLGLILDFVPNHIGVHFADNPWWLDVLEWGPASPHAASFDIDWEQLPYRARGGVLLPIIGSSYGQALENGEIELRYDSSRRQFFGLVFRASAADRAGTLRRNPAHDPQGGRRGGKRARQGHACAGLALSGAATPQPQGSTCLQGRIEGHRRSAPTSSRAGYRPIAPGRIARRRRWRCTICSNASTTSSAIGGSPPATSTTGASSTSIRLQACASRTPARSRRSIAWSSG